jgi:hypothetical protein
MAMVNIKGMDKAEVLLALWKASQMQGMSFLGFLASGELTLSQARKEIQERKHTSFDGTDSIYFDYLNGKVMKVDLGQDEFDPRLYDRDNGDGAAQRAIDNLKIAVKVKSGEISYSDIPTEAAKADMLIDKAEVEKFIGGDQS